jgi:hypothetical protein
MLVIHITNAIINICSFSTNQNEYYCYAKIQEKMKFPIMGFE